MKPSGIITLLTDFGLSDGYVATMKGVILSINPKATIIDLSHDIPAQDVAAAAFVLEASFRYFPRGTIHVAVVDPTVGTNRKILAVKSSDYWFLAPDNQLLKYVFHAGETLTVVEVLNKRFFLGQVSQTFHGRDIFAPIAAHLSLGVDILQLGELTSDYDRGQIHLPSVSKHEIIGKVIYCDRFGNLITNIEATQLPKHEFRICVGDVTIPHLSQSYAEVEIGQPLAIVGSSGFLEIAIRNGNAQNRLSASPGTKVTLKMVHDR
ncbi:MAG: SAM-dependent chlorinase/fluorinase [candidate division KSB1 bacterium]|nr:SAM-dependent chlorinase/fluorinase [candidate division KSB1 bacterium]MDZ7334999.1 SAM-dependent chlorinase/fluorinase [candidate division KSB1 bacterium]MDZ7357124.1 SAM-dependent chlorinase/fluorinase [candidate division KSB1 bacterium]MDZ7375697.1 SAM-dependent chlorinase/fluorinase [candidate division KSB1 bacterium]MDZ7400192.1 SAM-dependent chlorinase/fluorinase [candidate division KSB1 bacterium]